MLGEHKKNFSSVLPTSQVGYHAGKPIESVVYRYLYNDVNATRAVIGRCP